METQIDGFDGFFADRLAEPVNALPYRVARALAARFPDQHLLASDDGAFDVEPFALAGRCRCEPAPAPPHPRPLFAHRWDGKAKGVTRAAAQVWWAVEWEGVRFDLVQMTYLRGVHSEVTYRWLVGPEAACRRFFAAVCEWNSRVRGEVLVFSGGCWRKSASLFTAIRSATFDNLVLPGDLKRAVRDDLAQFFASRDVYERYRVPWKRGLLLVGPPGNGKTHTVKALVNDLGVPCLYVKSLKAQYVSDHDTLRAVFERARETTPCLLVMEDLDALINDRNRSFFLNELDGFEANTGIVLLATTNHPEKLDPAIADRPSRFDRKYHFPLPADAERAAYVAQWNADLEPDLRLSEAGAASVVAATDGFSFAYLKELFLSSMMRWVGDGALRTPGAMDAVMAEQVHVLRAQMASPAALSAPSADADAEADPYAAAVAAMRKMEASFFAADDEEDGE